jgi:hypothetical protein
MFHSFHNNSLGFQCVQPPNNMWTVHFKGSRLTAVGDVTDILKEFSNHVCYSTQALPQFQLMNFLYVILVTPGFLKLPEGFQNICGPQP